MCGDQFIREHPCRLMLNLSRQAAELEVVE
jgi:hypothetical protein